MSSPTKQADPRKQSGAYGASVPHLRPSFPLEHFELIPDLEDRGPHSNSSSRIYHIMLFRNGTVAGKYACVLYNIGRPWVLCSTGRTEPNH
ncbi:hypothetical protein VSDG_01080 [Cytospora chrysosperma]|uniref:Uncharacterized protein n=1 Tax=Cytospora chrysosperma TaxID=252740 RepID=A0A423WKN2_CYTCH|nr:hypothetical protein VSDG_01080 [Valsa sordida]